MKKNLPQISSAIFFLIILASPLIQNLNAEIPSAGNNKVAYYVYDSGGPDHYPLTSFTDEANVVVLFEGKLWELADSVHYETGWMRNVNYHYYSEIIRDVRILQSRGVKVLINVDDAASWSTSTPFTTYDGIGYDYKQFAAFIKACAIDSLHLDGISLDIEHGASWNEAYKNLLKELGKYFGPKSSDSSSQMYIAAIYSGGAPGPKLGQSAEITSYMNFIMDMAYFSSFYVLRFNQWANSIGNSKTMIGVLNDYFDLTYATNVAKWQPTTGTKAGVMVYAANNLKSYTDSVFRSLTVPSTEVNEPEQNIPQSFALLQNYPNPFNPSTTISYSLLQNGRVSLKVYDMLGREIITLADEVKPAGNYSAEFTAGSGSASALSSGVYFARLIVETENYKSYTKTIKMILSK
ncbi:MAG: T9SS C-terminal target domain-containing protein [Ignavibacteriales bacterium]|nr:MAG: T9SS C-terminal target domain-containing protein [Ignavibacteriales bacterium]